MFREWLKRVWPSKKTGSSLIKILVIEDSPVDAAMVKKAVDVCGFSSLVACDGKTGIEMARTHKPDLVILDYNLPDINGGKVLHELRALKETSSETVVVLTVLKSSDVIYDSFMSGADQYFTKPISVSLLAKQIKKMLPRP